MREVMVRWVLPSQLDEALDILDAHRSELALATLQGIAGTHEKMLSSIWASLAHLLAAYRSEAALATCDRPNFDAHAFVRSAPANAHFVRRGETLTPNLQGTMRAASTLYVIARGEDQEMVAPLVAALLTEIRDAAYELQRDALRSGTDSGMPPVVFALDELAHIAPLGDLPETLAQGGGRGVLIAGCLHDLSQARHRWKERADGFLTLFGDKVILPGVADKQTLEHLELLAGEYDRTVETLSENAGPTLGVGNGLSFQQGSGVSVTHRREHRLPASAIHRGLAPGSALLLQGEEFHVLQLTPYYSTSTWPQLLVRATELAAQRLDRRRQWWNWEPSYHPHVLLPTPELHPDVLLALGGRGLLDRWHWSLTNRKERT
jgi:hypothetical protein